MCKTSGPVIVAAVFVFLFGLPGQALAYLDPGSGSMMLQLLLGGVAGIAMVVKLYWENLINIFRRKKRDQSKTPSAEIEK